MSWLGEVVHNAIELPSLTILSPENSIPGLVAALLLGAYLFLPGQRVAIFLLFGWGLLNMIGGGIISVLPLSIFPYAPAQTLTHYLAHALYTVAEVPLVVTSWKHAKR